MRKKQVFMVAYRLIQAVNNIIHWSSKSAAIFNRNARFDIKVELVEYLRAVCTILCKYFVIQKQIRNLSRPMGDISKALAYSSIPHDIYFWDTNEYQVKVRWFTRNDPNTEEIGQSTG